MNISHFSILKINLDLNILCILLFIHTLRTNQLLLLHFIYLRIAWECNNTPYLMALEGRQLHPRRVCPFHCGVAILCGINVSHVGSYEAALMSQVRNFGTKSSQVQCDGYYGWDWHMRPAVEAFAVYCGYIVISDDIGSTTFGFL